MRPEQNYLYKNMLSDYWNINLDKTLSGTVVFSATVPEKTVSEWNNIIK